MSASRRRAWAGATPLLLCLVALVTGEPGAALAQEESAGDDAATERQMAEAPLQFRLSGFAGAFLWGTAEGIARIDDLATFGLDLESRVNRYVAFRLDGSYGRTTATDDTSSVRINQWTFDLIAVGRVAVASLVRTGLVPFGELGVGAVVLDPSGDEIRDRSQGAWSFGGGLELDPRGRWGGRIEYRYHRVSLEDVLDPLDRSAGSIGASLISASVYWKL